MTSKPKINHYTKHSIRRGIMLMRSECSYEVVYPSWAYRLRSVKRCAWESSGRKNVTNENLKKKIDVFNISAHRSSIFGRCPHRFRDAGNNDDRVVIYLFLICSLLIQNTCYVSLSQTSAQPRADRVLFRCYGIYFAVVQTRKSSKYVTMTPRRRYRSTWPAHQGFTFITLLLGAW